MRIAVAAIVSRRRSFSCDGGHSAVRKLLGVPFPGIPGRMSSVVADLTLASRSETVPRVSEHFSRYPKSANGFFTVLHPIDGERYRLIFGRFAAERPDRELPITTEEVQEALTAVYGPETTLGELLAASRFSDATRQVENYREGRVLFAGGAAHIHLPIGGQGVNLGIQDAINLGWKLAAAVRGWAPEGLLDSYHTERHPVAARVLRTTRAQSMIMNPSRDADLATVRDLFTDLLRLPDTNYFVSGMMSGLDIDYPGVGPRMLDVDLTTADGPTRMVRLSRSPRAIAMLRGALVPAPTRNRLCGIGLPDGMALPPGGEVRSFRRGLGSLRRTIGVRCGCHGRSPCDVVSSTSG
ncbi:FAD-dependent monooxygenase [Nocardia sp. NPDC052001]|uniref:FAD-dependent monooxygenase n=1 Tax=Nocardia sp. NPDC052001 TaxID=3154853 RepID=UPI0034254CC3